MTGPSVVVVGGGVAGTAAAIAAASVGVQVRLVFAHPGASVLSAGHAPAISAQTPEIAELATRVLCELGTMRVDSACFRVPTVAGTLRQATIADRALFPFDDTLSGTVLVPRADHAEWDADHLARAWTECARELDRDVRFVAVDGQITRFREELGLAHVELAERHDDPHRLGWLRERLRELLGRHESARAILLPPWLGSIKERRSELESALGVRVGEASVGLAGPVGARFEAARGATLTRLGVRMERAKVKRVRALDRRVTLTVEGTERLEPHTAVLCMGGLVGGGVVLASPFPEITGDAPSRAIRPFLLGVESNLSLGADGVPLETPGSLEGYVPERLFEGAHPMFDRVGVLARPTLEARGAPGVFVAGDLLADRPRTWTAALVTGAQAGLGAARLAAQRAAKREADAPREKEPAPPRDPTAARATRTPS